MEESWSEDKVEFWRTDMNMVIICNYFTILGQILMIPPSQEERAVYVDTVADC